MPHAFLCDFDGTVSPFDIGASFARRFSPDGAAESPAFLARWMRGEMGHRELTEAQCALLSVTRDEALAFVRTFTIDPDFAPFVHEAKARGDAVAVVSEGFDFYVRDLLERDGLGALPWSANVARFDGGRVRPEFPATPDGCGRCGNCKGSHVRAWRARGYRTVLIGDGLSDRCGAAEADRVLARRDLLAWCRQEGMEVTPFETFADVRRWSSDQAPAGAGPGVPRGVGRPRSAARGARSRGPATSGNPWPRPRRS
jgi:2-hydroxy-3-keto-5-methylthiopentenyl-1-phosphate phosphatase